MRQCYNRCGNDITIMDESGGIMDGWCYNGWGWYNGWEVAGSMGVGMIDWGLV